MKKDNNVDSLGSKSSAIGYQANHTEKAIDIAAIISIPNNIVDIQDNNVICEANECYKQATDEIELDVGQFGKISLYVCKNCLPKFTIAGVD